MTPESAREEAIKDLDDVVHKIHAARYSAKGNDWPGLDTASIVRLTTRAHAVIERRAPAGSIYRGRLKALKLDQGMVAWRLVPEALGLVQALKEDYEAGQLSHLPAMIQGDTFQDFLEMAEHLLENHYSDAALITAVGVLEQHVRKFAAYRGVEVKSADSGPPKASAVNDALAKTYRSAADHDRVSVWLKMRNLPAHGAYE